MTHHSCLIWTGIGRSVVVWSRIITELLELLEYNKITAERK